MRRRKVNEFRQRVPVDLTVSCDTKAALDRICNRAEIPVGGAIDYVLLNYKPDTPELVAPIAQTAIEVCLSGLDDRKYEKAIIKMAASFALAVKGKREEIETHCEQLDVQPSFEADDTYYQCIKEVEADNLVRIERFSGSESMWNVETSAGPAEHCVIHAEIMRRTLASFESNSQSMKLSYGGVLDRFMQYFAMPEYTDAVDFLSRELAQIVSWGSVKSCSQCFPLLAALFIGRLPFSCWDDLNSLMEQELALAAKETGSMTLKQKAHTLLMLSRMGKKESEQGGGIIIDTEE